MSKISDELRKWCDLYFGEVSLSDDCNWLRAIANRIDAEMVELPLDRDGVPIHVSDPVFGFLSGDALFANGILMKAGRVCVRVNHAGKADDWYTTPNAITHKRPDSLERIADELEGWSESNRINGSGEVFYRAGDLADRIRKLVKKEGEHGTD